MNTLRFAYLISLLTAIGVIQGQTSQSGPPGGASVDVDGGACIIRSAAPETMPSFFSTTEL